MNNILSSKHISVLEQLAWSNVLLAFDFDGTLAPIVSDPDEARMADTTRALLEKVARQYPCIVISGRAQADVLRRVRGVGILEAIGNHGLEPWRRTESYAAPVQRWIPAIERAMEGFKGVHLEDKHFSLAVHYRHCREKTLFREALQKAIDGLDEVRVVGGKEVVNLLPANAPNKGTALQAARERLRYDTALFVGDDETDEDVFRLYEPGRLLGVRVGQSDTSQAPFFLERQESIDELLEELLRLRPAKSLRAGQSG